MSTKEAMKQLESIAGQLDAIRNSLPADKAVMSKYAGQELAEAIRKTKLAVSYVGIWSGQLDEVF